MYLLYILIITRAAQAQVTHHVNVNAIVDVSAFEVDGVDKNIVSRGLVEAGYNVARQKLTGYVSVVLLRGENASDYVGDIQAFSNIDEDEFEGIYEAWGQYQLLPSTFVKAGLMDLNNDFAFAENALEFLNGAMGLSPTVFTLPTYPEPATSFMFEHEISAHQRLRVAVSAGAGENSFSDRFYIGEWHYSNEQISVKIGGWEHDGSFINITDGLVNQGAGGAYTVVEGPIARSGWHYYLQAGTSDAIVAEIDRHYGIGLMLDNAMGRENMMAGIAYTYVRLNNYLPIDQTSEKALEVFVKSNVTKWLSVKPNLQYIENPSGENRNELVATLRLELSF